jgi:hypothetical protein
MVGYVDEINSVNAPVCRCHTECELLPGLAVGGTSGVTADTVEFTCVVTAAIVVVRISFRTDILFPFFVVVCVGIRSLATAFSCISY